MNREEVRDGLKSIFDFLRGEIKSYQESLERYIKFINTYKNIYIFGGGIYGIQVSAILTEKLPNKSYCFIDNDKTKWGNCIGGGIPCFGLERLRACRSKIR